MITLKQFSELITTILILGLKQINLVAVKTINFSNFNTDNKLTLTSTGNEYKAVKHAKRFTNPITIK